MPSVSDCSTSKMTPKNSLSSRRHSMVNGLTLPSLAWLVFLSLKAMRVSRNHWWWVETTPAYLISSSSRLAPSTATSSGLLFSMAASAVSRLPVLVSATSDRLKPGDREPFSPLKQSVKTQTSGRYWLNTSLALVTVFCRNPVETLLPAQTPLMRLTYPFSSRVTLPSPLTEGTTTWTSPPPKGRQPRLVTFIWSSLSNPYFSFSSGRSSCWIESTEVSYSSFVTPSRCTFSECFENSDRTSRYSRQQLTHRSVPQSKSNSTPSLLVTRPGWNRSWFPPLEMPSLQPFEMLSTNFRKRSYSGRRPEGVSYWLIRSILTGRSDMIEHSSRCRRFAGFLNWIIADC